MSKTLFCSDIHGSVRYARLLIDAFTREGADKLVILGDLYYHGPRNPLSEEYSPQTVAVLLNEYSDKIIAVCGNCDSEVDRQISQFPFISDGVVTFGTLRVYLTHGHRYSADCLPSGVYDMFICGHTHVGELFVNSGIIVANTGSVALPKYGSRNSYIMCDEQKVSLCELTDGTRIKSVSL